MHCSQQIKGEGGDSCLCDGFLAAEQLREEHPDQFKLLSTIPIYWRDIGVQPPRNEYSMQCWQPTIGLVY